MAEFNANEKRITDEVENIKQLFTCADDSTVQRKFWSGVEGYFFSLLSHKHSFNYFH